MKRADPALIPSLTPKQFLLRGLAGCLLGTLIAFLNMFIFAMSPLFRQPFAAPLALGCCGLIAGAIHGGFLRRVTRPALLWLLLSGAGWLLVGFIESQHMIPWSSTGQRVISALFYGGLAALPQWLLLQRSLRFAAIWPVLTASTWLLLLFAMDWQRDNIREMLRWIANRVL
jgi:hypothetical protein